MSGNTRPSRIVSISLPRKASEELDRLAREQELSRSALLREAIREYRRARERAELERLLRLGERYGRASGIQTEAAVARLLHRGKRTTSCVNPTPPLRKNGAGVNRLRARRP